jgi:phosphoglycolate phosphatase-like HAD superfamily hydrolase
MTSRDWLENGQLAQNEVGRTWATTGLAGATLADIASRPANRYAGGPMVKLVFFDIDGTLVHTGGAGIKAFAKVFATEFNVANGVERIKFAGRTDVSLVREFFALNRIEAAAGNFQRFFERYVFWLDQILRHSETTACPGVWEFIYDLRQLPHPPVLGLLTGNIRLGAEIKLRHFDLWKEFATGGFADDHEDRDQIAHAARRRGECLLGGNLRGDEVLVIGDTPLDIRCGRAIGAKVLAVATGGAQLKELQEHRPDWAVADLRCVTAQEVCGWKS